jgi:hypothetical protein
MPKESMNPHRINIYMNPTTRRKMQIVGKKLDESGVFGVVGEDGNVSPSALFRYLIEREIRAMKVSEEELKEAEND